MLVLTTELLNPAREDGCAIIYVTTAGGKNGSEEGTGAEALFRLNLGIRGVPEFPSRIGLSKAV